MHLIKITAALALAALPSIALAAPKPIYGTSVNTSLRRCNVAPGADCPGGPVLKTARPGASGKNFSAARLDANAGTPQAGSYATGSAELRGAGLPIIRGSVYAAGTDSRLVGGAQAWQSFTWTGAQNTNYNLAGTLRIDDSFASPANFAAPGGAGYTAFIAIWDAAAFPVDRNAAPFFNLPSFDPNSCSYQTGLLGYASASGNATGGAFSINLATTSCSGSPIVLSNGQQIVVHTNMSLFANRGGFIDASHSFITTLDPALGASTLAALGENLVQGGPSVPEPASWAMLITGFGLTGAALRRRRIRLA